MNDVLKFGKKIFTFSVVTLTIAWSMGLAALMPTVVQAATCPTLEAGDLFSVPTSKAVYLVSSDMGRQFFQHSSVFFSWFENYDGVKNISTECGGAYPSDGFVPYRAGSTLVKNITFPAVYAVLPGGELAHITSPEVAEALYGSDWEDKYLDLTDQALDRYTDNGAEVDSAMPHNGMLVKKDGDTQVYWVKDGKYLELDGDLSAPTKDDVQTVSADVFATLEVSGDTTTDADILSDVVMEKAADTPDETPDETTTAGDVTVSLAANTPPAGYIAKGAYNADFLKLTFKAVGGDARVDKIVLKRDGLGADANLTAIRLYDGSTKVGSDQAINTNTHLATFKNLNWDLTKGETKTLTIKADTAGTTAGTYDYLALTEVELEGEGSISASLPLAGNNMQYHAVTMGVLDVDAKTTPAATDIISGATDQQVACYNFDTNSAEGFYVKSLTLTNAGTVAQNDITKFVLKEGADTLSTVEAGFEDNGTMTFDMTEDPYFIDKSKSKDLCVYVDTAAGIKDSLGKTIILQIAEYGHVTAVGDLSKAQVVVTIDDATTFTAQSSQTMTIAQGTLTVARNTATLPVSAALIDGVEHNKLAAYKFTGGSTEGALITRLRLTVSGSGVAAADLSNFELYTYDEDTAEETMVGTSQSISGSYVTFEDTNDGLFEVPKSKNVILHVYADVNTAAAWTGTVANVFIGSTNSDLIIKAKGLESKEFLTATDITLSSVSSAHGNVVLFSNSNNGALTLSLANDTPAATSIAKGTNTLDFLHAKLYATGEDMDVTSLTFRAYEDSGTGTTDAIETADSAITNVHLYDVTDAANPVELGTAVASPAAGVATFNFDITVSKDNYKVLKLVGDVPTDASNSYIKFAVASANVATDMTSTGAYSGVDITETGSAVGKTMTVATPSLAVAWGVTPPAQSVVTGAQAVHVATLNLTAGAYEDVKVTSVKVLVDDASALNSASEATHSSYGAALSNFMIKSSDGEAQYGNTLNLTDGTPDYVQFTGITNLTVAKGQTKQLYLYLDVVTTTAGTWYFGTTATSNITASGVASGGSASVTGTGASTAQSVVGSATITFTKDSSTEAEHLVAVGASGTGTEVEMLTLDADAAYSDVDLTKLVFHYQGVSGDNAIGGFADNGVKLYKKVNGGSEVLVGSTTFVSSTITTLDAANHYTATFNLAEGALRVDKDDTTLLIVKTVFNGVSNGASSAFSPMLQFGNGTTADTSIVEAKSVGPGTTLAVGSINGSSTINIDGNNRVMYKTYPTFTHVNLDSATMVSGVENDIYKFKAKANGNGNVSLKQLKFDLDIVDNYTVGAPDTNMAVGTFKLYRGSTNITDSVTIMKSTGLTVEATNTFVSGTGQSFYIVWTTTDEETIPAGTEYTYTVKATLAGFDHDAHNDYVRVRLANADTTELSVSNDPYYLTLCDLETHNATVCLADSDSANTTTANILWSDRSASSHSAATGTYAAGGDTASSTGDWFNGYKVTDTPTNYSTLTY